MLFFCVVFMVTQTAAAKGLETCEDPPELGAERALAVGGGLWAEHEGGGDCAIALVLHQRRGAMT